MKHYKTGAVLLVLAVSSLASEARRVEKLGVACFYTHAAVASHGGHYPNLTSKINQGINKANAMIQNTGMRKGNRSVGLKVSAWYRISLKTARRGARRNRNQDVYDMRTLFSKFRGHKLRATRSYNREGRGENKTYHLVRESNSYLQQLTCVPSSGRTRGGGRGNPVGIAALPGRSTIVNAFAANTATLGHEIGHNFNGRHQLAFKHAWVSRAGAYTYQFTPMFSANKGQSDHSNSRFGLGYSYINTQRTLKYGYPGYRTYGRYNAVWGESYWKGYKNWWWSKRDNRHRVLSESRNIIHKRMFR